MPLAQVWTQLRAQLIFPSKPKFCNLFKFAATKSTPKSISFHTFSDENCEINSIKSGLRIAFQQLQEHLQIPIGFSVSILFRFHWENGPIINSFHTGATNGLKPSCCTTTHQELSEDTESTAWSAMVWEISTWQTKQNQTALLCGMEHHGLGDLSMTNKTKQNKLPCFIDRLRSCKENKTNYLPS